MRNLVLFLLKNKDHISYCLAIALSLFLLFNENGEEMGIIRGISSDFVSFLSTPIVKIKSLTLVNQENQFLREKNLQLTLQLESLLYASNENNDLRELLNFKRESSYEILPASIVNKGIHANLNSLTIDVGKNKGIDINQAVLSPYGIIGKVIEVGMNSAIVQSISDNNFRVSVRIMPSGAVGILRWYKDSVYKIYEVQKNVEINIGDRVITSGFSQIYPPKMPIGIVSGVYDERGSYQKVVNVKIQSNLEAIQNVFVIINYVNDYN